MNESDFDGTVVLERLESTGDGRGYFELIEAFEQSLQRHRARRALST